MDNSFKKVSIEEAISIVKSGDRVFSCVLTKFPEIRLHHQRTGH